MERKFGVHSEVGKLKTVMVCRPGLAHQRLTPGNCRDLLFDDVIWVEDAQNDHYDFVLKMQQRGVGFAICTIYCRKLSKARRRALGFSTGESPRTASDEW
jgi:arginine deiminase